MWTAHTSVPGPHRLRERESNDAARNLGIRTPARGHSPPSRPRVGQDDPLPGTLTTLLGGQAQATDTGPLSPQSVESFDYLQQRLEVWCEHANYQALAEELIQGIEAKVSTHTPDPQTNPTNDSTQPNGND